MKVFNRFEPIILLPSLSALAARSLDRYNTLDMSRNATNALRQAATKHLSN